jgi:4-oxalocrotonate tautomerase
MPLIRIDLARGKDARARQSIGDVVYRAMVEVVNVPKDDRFQIITEHGPDGLSFAPSYLGVPHSPGIVFIQITLNQGRTVEQKKALYKRIADDLQREVNIDRQDVIINLIEVSKENWSFGNGEAQYAP